MPKIGPTTPPTEEPKYLPLWRRPLISLMIQGLDAKVTEKELQDKFKDAADDASIVLDMKKYLPKGLKWLVSLAIFILKRNPLEALGLTALASGGGFYILSLLKPILKWGGIIIAGLGAVGVIAGKIVSIKLTPATGTTEERRESKASVNPSTRNSSGEDTPGLAQAGAN